MGNRFLLNDINGNPIGENQKFTFILTVAIYLKIDKVKLTGSFRFDEQDLRYVIDIEDNQFYTCLNYNPESMSSFELVK